MSEEKQVLFSRSELRNEEEEDVWDDRALIKAYNKSIRSIKKTLNEKSKTEALKEEEKETAEGYESDTEEEEEEEEEEEIGQENELDYYKPVGKEWKEGDSCLAVYSEDGLIYEAQIVKIFDAGETRKKCIVRFSFYLNEEEKYLDELYEHRKETIQTIENPEIELKKPKEESNKKEAKQTKKLNEKPKINETIKKFPEMSKFGFTMPPPPPPPNAVFNLFKSENTKGEINKEDALYSMLMSWYMSGYHTGYYLASMRNEQ